MVGNSQEFERELDTFRKEGDSAVQFFYSWLSIHAAAGQTPNALAALNKTPLFWNTTLGALQTATFVTLGRIFDPSTNNHSVTKLLSLAMNDLSIFSKEALAERKRKESTNADEWLPEYLRDVFVPNVRDIRRLKQHVAKRRKIYERVYQPIRHQHYAHRSASSTADIDSLFGKTNIRELQQLLTFFRRLHEALWQLYINGKKPTLRPTRYSVNRMLEKPSPNANQAQLQERLVHETKLLINSLP